VHAPAVVAVQLPSLLQKVVNGLKAKSQGERDNARATLVGMAGLLGPQFVGFQVALLRSALTKGFQRHVLGYTLHALLHARAGPWCAVGAFPGGRPRARAPWTTAWRTC